MKEKITMAFEAMEKIGIERERVKPVLKRLLHEYDNHWEHIEAENYRTLADAIFEAQDSKEGCSTDNKKVPSVSKGHREKRLKISEGSMSSHNPRRDGPAYQPPSHNRVPAQKRPFCEPSTPTTNYKPVPHVPSQTQALVPYRNLKGADDRNEQTQNSAAMARYDLAVALPQTGERSVARCSRGGSISLAEPKTEPDCDRPLAVVHPSYRHPSRSSKEKAKGKGKGKELVESDQGTSTNLEIANTGDVNLSFICRNNILSDPSFQTPSIEAICKDVEDRCLASYKIRDPKFSVRNILNEVCQSFSELGYKPQQKRRNMAGHSLTSSDPSSHLLNMALVSTSAPTPHCADDISRGEEMVRISIERGTGGHEEYPPQFHYIARNIPYQNAYISISLARIGDESCCFDCFEDCLQKPFACACASETAGVFAYTKRGLLQEEFLDACMTMLRDPKQSNYFFCKEGCPLESVKNDEQPEKCKGHLMRKFIKECWVKCGCKRQCGNRVVQRGITCNLQVFKTGQPKGWGLRTMDSLPKGKFVCEYVGEILTNIELYDRQMRSSGNERHTYPVLLDADWGTEGVLKDEEALCLDATYYGNVARFINHRCFDGNLIGIPIEIETPDHHYYHLAFFTTREVSAMEELTWDYGIDFDDDKHPIKAFPCRCGSKYCRDRR